MPKIPSYVSRTTITEKTPSVTTNIQVSPFQTTAGALRPLGKAAEDYYVKEKQTEANNKAIKITNESYENQSDGTQGLFEISNELKSNPNPSEVNIEYENRVNKLWNSIEQNKLVNENRFVKNALKKRFFATTGVLKADVLKGSRNQLYKDTQKNTDQFVLKESLLLKQIGPTYLPIYQKKINNLINSNQIFDEGSKKQLQQNYLTFGEVSLANTLLNSNPKKLKKLLSDGFFKNVSIKDLSSLSEKTDKAIFEQNINQVTAGLEYIPGMEIQDLYNNFKQIRDGNFTNKIQQDVWNNFSEAQKQEVLKKSISKFRESEFLYKQYNQDIDRKSADESKKAFENLKKSVSGSTYDINTINSLYESNKKIKLDLLKINEMVESDEVIKDSFYNKKVEILKKVSNGSVISIEKPFTLPGEFKSLSLVDRVINKEISKKDLENFNTLLSPNGVNDETKNNMDKFFNFIEDTELLISGMPSFRFFDLNYDKRLNLYVDTMYKRFINGLASGKDADDLLNNKSKDYIAKDANKFKPIREDFERQVVQFKKKMKGYDKKLPGETVEEYKKRILGE